MDSAKKALVLVCYGMKDCVYGVFLLQNVLSSKQPETTVKINQQSLRFKAADITFPFHTQRQECSVSNILFQCIIFGALFWLAIFTYNNYVLGWLFEHFMVYMNEDSKSFVWLQKCLYCFFCISWIFPLLLLSKVLNFFWYKDIADLTVKKVGIRSMSEMSMSQFYADQIKSLVLQMFYYVQSYVVFILPLPTIIQNIWYLFHLSLLSSLYAFEYKWLYLGWPLHRRLLTIDRKWPYFLGFGLPLAIITTYVDSFINSMIIFTTLFPIYVISSTVTYDSQSPIFSRPFHSFRVVDSLSDAVVSFCLRLR